MPDFYNITRAPGTKAVTLTGPGELKQGKPFPNVREAALHARDYNQANGDGEAAVRLFRLDGTMEDERPIPHLKSPTMPW